MLIPTGNDLQNPHLRALAQPDPWRWLAHISGEWPIIAAYMVLAYAVDQVVAYVVAASVIGTRQHALGLLYHDGAHGLISRRKWLNDGLTIFCVGLPLGIPLAGYRQFHFRHHRCVGTVDDPELSHKRSLPQWTLPNSRGRIYGLMLFDLVGAGIPHIAFVIYLARPRQVWEGLLVPMFIAAVLWACWVTGLWWIPLMWWGGLLTTFWAVFRHRIWFEHVGTNQAHRFTARRWERWLFFPYQSDHHWEHHLAPGVPCHRLPAVRQLYPLACPSGTADLFAHFSQSSAIASGHLSEVSLPPSPWST